MSEFEPDKMDWREDPCELSEALSRTASVGQEVLLWQVIEEKRVAVKALVHFILLEQEIVVLQMPKNLKGFKANLDFYVKLKDRDTLFVTSMVKRQGDKLFLSFPKRYRIKENRSSKRMALANKYNLKVVMRKIEDNVLGQTQFDFILKDISSIGIGVTIGVSKFDSLKSCTKLEILSIGPQKLEKPLIAHIVNLGKQGEGGNQHLKIGLTLAEPLDLEFLKQFL